MPPNRGNVTGQFILRHIKEGGFSQYLYKDESRRVNINGVTGKMISKGVGGKSVHDGLPTYSNTCDIYFKKGEDGLACQAKLYKERKAVLDFDWDHSHTNADGSKFGAGTVHVQVYKVDKQGNIERMSKYARRMTGEEVRKYGPIIHYFNKNVIF